jgi:hypothetical protein
MFGYRSIFYLHGPIRATLFCIKKEITIRLKSMANYKRITNRTTIRTTTRTTKRITNRTTIRTTIRATIRTSNRSVNQFNT